MLPTIRAKATIRKVGNSYCVTIPMHYITNGLLKPEQEITYTITLGEDNAESTD